VLGQAHRRSGAVGDHPTKVGGFCLLSKVVCNKQLM
jgi:hypothetical protein